MIEGKGPFFVLVLSAPIALHTVPSFHQYKRMGGKCLLSIFSSFPEPTLLFSLSTILQQQVREKGRAGVEVEVEEREEKVFFSSSLCARGKKEGWRQF